MGWSFFKTARTRVEMMQMLNSREGLSPHVRLIANCLRGNHHWQVLEMLPSHPNHGQMPSRRIVLNLLAPPEGDSGWGYKTISEGEGPFATDCPLSYLRLVPPDGHNGRQWRTRVQADHAVAAARPALRAGQTVVINASPYELVESLGRRGWTVRSMKDGKIYRASSRTLNAAVQQQAIAA